MDEHPLIAANGHALMKGVGAAEGFAPVGAETHRILAPERRRPQAWNAADP
jgi:hypothetical protein